LNNKPKNFEAGILAIPRDKACTTNDLLRVQNRHTPLRRFFLFQGRTNAQH
jgi:hypothetical protein